VEGRKTDEWIVTILNMVKFLAWDSAIYRVSPSLEMVLSYLIPAKIRQGAVNHVLSSKAKILARMEKGQGERKDFCSYVSQIKEEMRLNDWNMAAYGNALILAGSETSGTTLSALTYFLCRTPRVYDKLKQEVRSRFKSSSEITSVSATFPYLTAVINEALRIYPPVPFGAPRIVSKGGDFVDGHFVPEGVSLPIHVKLIKLTSFQTTVSVHAWSSTHNAKNFKDPDSFIPERWLDPESTDNLSASNPFSVGPRNCIGQKCVSQ
jgi:cytochrome P450